MRASTEEFLYVMLWTAESFMRPTWRNLVEDSFEAWAFRNGIARRLAQLEAQKLIEKSDAAAPRQGVFRLTETGRVQALGGRDPVERWTRPWDGRWRLLMFDLPARATALRTRLRRYLRAQSYGYLQNSVWLTPDTLDEARRQLDRYPENAEALVLFEGRPVAGVNDADLVAGAWDFASVNKHYTHYLEILAQCPLKRAPGSAAERTRLLAWTRRERQAWHAAIRADPLLPAALLPRDYAGRRAWQARCDTFASIAGARQ